MSPRNPVLACAAVALATASAFAQANDYPIHSVPPTAVKLRDAFWAPRLEINRTVTIPHVVRQLERVGSIEEFELLAGRKSGKPRGYMWGDSDVYKTLQGMTYSLQAHPDPALQKRLDDLISCIAAAQQPDGYLMPHVQLTQPGYGHFSREWETCELYCMGHLIESAAAHHEATGRRDYLDVAVKCGDLLVKTYGPDKQMRPPGHPEVELALVRLFRATGDRKYLDLAARFVSQAQTVATPWSEKKPFLGHDEAVGHAVAANYLFCGALDVAMLTGDAALAELITRKWDNMASKKMYLTGGIGVRTHGEGYGDNYELPSPAAYCETCAAIANALWSYRLFQAHGDAKYLDVLERTICNGVLSGVSLGGDRFFYVNPLSADGANRFNHGEKARFSWTGCACCPTNIPRFLLQVPAYVYATRDNGLCVNLFVDSVAEVKLGNRTVKLTQETRYPWEGKVRMTVEPQSEGQFPVRVRVPGWALGRPVPSDLYRYLDAAPGEVRLVVNGEKFPLRLEKGFACVDRSWKKGDVIELDLPMPIRRVAAHANVQDDRQRVALERGPIVYCVEGADHGGHVHHLTLPDDVRLSSEFRPGLLGGVVVLRGTALASQKSGEGQPTTGKVPLMAVPYCVWCNRGPGEMTVWLPR